jgi:hypothetical protein
MVNFSQISRSFSCATRASSAQTDEQLAPFSVDLCQEKLVIALVGESGGQFHEDTKRRFVFTKCLIGPAQLVPQLPYSEVHFAPESLSLLVVTLEGRECLPALGDGLQIPALVRSQFFLLSDECSDILACCGPEGVQRFVAKLDGSLLLGDCFRFVVLYNLSLAGFFRLRRSRMDQANRRPDYAGNECQQHQRCGHNWGLIPAEELVRLIA